MILFRHRQDAGQQLAQHLIQYKNNTNAIVLALPRGGVPVANEVAKNLHLPLDIFVVRKLGVPFHSELAMGAIASGGTIFLNDDVIADLAISKKEIERVIQEETAELARRESCYRKSSASFPNLTGKIVILIDDGIATGATFQAAILALKKLSLKKIIVAVPVAPASVVESLSSWVDEWVCLYSAPIFHGVSMFYQDFSQTTDAEVQSLLFDTKQPL